MTLYLSLGLGALCAVLGFLLWKGARDMAGLEVKYARIMGEMVLHRNSAAVLRTQMVKKDERIHELETELVRSNPVPLFDSVFGPGN